MDTASILARHYLDAHHDVLRFGWTLHGPDGAEVVRGMDVATLGSDGRLASVAGFLDTAV